MVNPYLAQQYRDHQVTSSTPEETVLVLYNGAVNFLNSAARELNENQNISQKAKLIEKAVNIIDYLQSCLDMDKGGEIAKNLNSIYDYMAIRLTEANLKNDGDKIEEVVNLLRTLKEGWAEICRGREKDPPDMVSQSDSVRCQVKA